MHLCRGVPDDALPVVHAHAGSCAGRDARLVTSDHALQAHLPWCLAEVDARRRYLALGFPSIYRFLVDRFHMSEDVANNRTRVARFLRRYPYLAEDIAAERLGLTGLFMLAAHVTASDAAEVFALAREKTNAQIRCMLAERFPQPDVPMVVLAELPTMPATPVRLPAHPVRTPARPD